MGVNSAIAWCSSTFNAWRGCVEVSPACDNCYAREMSGRNPKALGTWGPIHSGGVRVFASEVQWRDVEKWNRDAGADLIAAEYAGSLARPTAPRVFVNSLADVFEAWQGPLERSGRLVWHCQACAARAIAGGGFWNAKNLEPDSQHCPACGKLGEPATMADALERLFNLVIRCPALDFLFLTKRPKRAVAKLRGFFRGDSAAPWSLPPNLWVGVTVEGADFAWRLDELRKIPAAVRFVSAEPLLEPLDGVDFDGVDWIIVGGESGRKPRTFDVEWIDGLRDQAAKAGAAFFVKQLGAYCVDATRLRGTDSPRVDGLTILEPLRLALKDRAGADPEEWPERLRVRELPIPKRRTWRY